MLGNNFVQELLIFTRKTDYATPLRLSEDTISVKI